ncbi:MAG: flavin reductase family protein [Bacteroidia bacterium]|nr:flavin reductase family protein [Bacteroidia bacterium]
MIIVPKDTPTKDLHQYLLGGIAPRPIAFVSTIDKNGHVNLAPFSFFNVFSAKPPIVVFSPAYSGKTGLSKNTLDNVKEHPECVINVVNYAIVHKMNLASSPYPKGVSEFEKAGFTPILSDIVKPPRVKESPVQMECKIQQIIELGKEGGAGNLVIAEVLRIHIDDKVLDDNKMIDPRKIDLVSRMNGNWYCRANGDALFELNKLDSEVVVGIDAIPSYVKELNILSETELVKLASEKELPTEQEIQTLRNEIEKKLNILSKENFYSNLCLLAKEELKKNNVREAWKYLLIPQLLNK